MTNPPVGIERRAGQRFPYLLPLSLRQPGTSVEGVGFTQDLGSRGAFFFTEAPLTEGSEIELTLRMPSEITLGESMPVRCRGHSLADRPATLTVRFFARGEPKLGVAVRLEGYEYLPESSEASATFPRVAVLHPSDPSARHEEDGTLAHASTRPVLG